MTFMPSLAVSLVLVPMLWFGPGDAAPIQEEGVDLAAARVHYRAVERELRDADVSQLDEQRRAARADVIEQLRAYREAELFGRNTLDPAARVPHFVDDRGRRCAVANLLHHTGHDALVSELAAANNDLFVVELSGDPRFAEWLEAVGLTFEEAVRIQFPLDRRNGDGPPPDMGGPGGGSGGGAAGGAPAGPIAPAGPGPDTTGPSSPPIGGGNGPGTPGSAPRTASGPAASTPIETQADAWWLWWEFNKLEFLRPNSVSLTRGPVTPGGKDPRDLMIRQQARWVPELIESLDDPVSGVRSAAAVALGRLAKGQAVEHLTPLLADATIEVREHALFALAATGSDEAAQILLSIAATGCEPGKRERVSRDAQGLALVALGVGCERGMDPAVAEEVAALLRRRPKAARVQLGLGAMLFETLHPTEAVGSWAEVWATDRQEPVAVRARAVEALRARQGGEHLRELTKILNGPRTELRRSAATALGTLDVPVSAPTLKTAFELEKEMLTRGLILIALGRTGGPDDVAFLAEVLAEESAPLRPWAALALGLIAREHADEAARKVLREAYAEENSADARGAFLLAFGLGRDARALDLLRTSLDANRADQRGHAALGLALLGGAEARTALLARLGEERSDLARTNMAHALGCLGDERDSAVLVETMTTLKSPTMQRVAALALSYHGSRDAFDGLLALTRDRATSPGSKAAAIQAVGMMLEGEARLDLARLSRRSNFPAFPEWTTRLMQVPL